MTKIPKYKTLPLAISGLIDISDDSEILTCGCTGMYNLSLNLSEGDQLYLNPPIKSYKSKLKEAQKQFERIQCAIQYALDQRDLDYGMKSGEAIQFRQGKVFSILEEILEELN